MNMKQTIQTNRQILGLILAKHEGHFPLNYKTPEARYYRNLKAETDVAEAMLKRLEVEHQDDPR